MSWYNFWKNTNKADVTEQVAPENPISVSNSTFLPDSAGGWVPFPSRSFDGEKNPGELGNVISLFPNHEALRARSHEANLREDLVKSITGKFFRHVIGTGLILKSEPERDVLKSEGVDLENIKTFRDLAETRFKIYSRSTYADYSGMVDLHEKALEAFKAAFLGGDCLVVLRLSDKGFVNVQVIDGQHVQSPISDVNFSEELKSRGNKIVRGVELNSKNQHVAFYVRKPNSFECERIEARGKKSGRLMAWMVYGAKDRIDHVRGIPVITQILEKVAKAGRYTEAVVGGAEERAKIPFAIEHNRDSTGENPMEAKIMQKVMGDAGETIIDPFVLGEALSQKIFSTTGKTAWNMPVGAKMNTLDSTQEINFPEFYSAIFEQACTAIDIPPEVARQKYSSNYSASRAAIENWNFTLKTYRDQYSKYFYKRFYSFWLEVEILKGKIQAPGYLQAVIDGNFMVVESYTNCFFNGENTPHIDPLKEVKAVKEMLGDSTKGEVPLISREEAAERLGINWFEAMDKYEDENEFLEDKGIEVKSIEDGNKTT